ncbi:hypothetical protein SAMD00019534_086740 [Acytostelium subglobosum LB1]|uniref:hypothetical protein n=1 Tax=Acytostelium subglobosum LB1 TaxID=1410327 RepID=UPI00064484DC|nr:hypothetical protein SAMD00019534_086740 [Acytostelium subglobosum LB1]GAM25499.1 hypothetical protein SAMD00019534_086740 [Acytostelium subglobosum LB1]|eukprot:XP_012751485.1 hypothetical protein SAMD00019534_086740 [Acytostelium subglobosum LB1]
MITSGKLLPLLSSTSSPLSHITRFNCTGRSFTSTFGEQLEACPPPPHRPPGDWNIFGALHTLDIALNFPRVNNEATDQILRLLVAQGAHRNMDTLTLRAFHNFPFDRLADFPAITSLGLNVSIFGFGGTTDSSQHSFAALAAYLESKTTSMRSLHFHFAGSSFKPTLTITPPDTAFSRAILSCQPLQHPTSGLAALRLSGVIIERPDAFFSGLSKLRCLTSLRFDSLVNTSATQFNAALATFLRQNNTLERLYLAFPAGEHIMKLLPNNTRISTLSLHPLFMVKFNAALRKLVLRDVNHATLDEFAKMNRDHAGLCSLNVGMSSTTKNTDLHLFGSIVQLIMVSATITRLKWSGFNWIQFRPLITALQGTRSVNTLKLAFSDELSVTDDEVDDHCFQDLAAQISKTMSLVLSSIDTFGEQLQTVAFRSLFLPDLTTWKSPDRFQIGRIDATSCTFIRNN